MSAERHIHHLLLVWECQGAAETGELWMVTWLAGAVLHPTAPKQEEQGCSTGLVARFSRESRSPGKSLLMEKACGQARKWSQWVTVRSRNTNWDQTVQWSPDKFLMLRQVWGQVGQWVWLQHHCNMAQVGIKHESLCFKVASKWKNGELLLRLPSRAAQ